MHMFSNFSLGSVYSSRPLIVDSSFLALSKVEIFRSFVTSSFAAAGKQKRDAYNGIWESHMKCNRFWTEVVEPILQVLADGADVMLLIETAISRPCCSSAKLTSTFLGPSPP